MDSEYETYAAPLQEGQRHDLAELPTRIPVAGFAGARSTHLAAQHPGFSKKSGPRLSLILNVLDGVLAALPPAEITGRKTGGSGE